MTTETQDPTRTTCQEDGHDETDRSTDDEHRSLLARVADGDDLGGPVQRLLDTSTQEADR